MSSLVLMVLDASELRLKPYQSNVFTKTMSGRIREVRMGILLCVFWHMLCCFTGFDPLNFPSH